MAVAIGAVMLAALAPVGVAPAFAVLAEPFALQRARLTAPDAVSAEPILGGGWNRENYGAAVATDGWTLVVGAPGHDQPGSMVAGPIPDVGEVYVYTRSGAGWNLQQQLFAPMKHADDLFGTSVAIQGNTIVVGAPGYDTAHGNTGAAFVFTKTGTTWSSAVTLATELEQDGDQIGQSVDINGDTIAVGCPGDGGGNGCVRPFTWNGASWSSGGGIQLLGAGGDRLGEGVAVVGDVLLASASGWLSGDGLHANAGSIVFHQRIAGAWAYRERIVAPMADWATNARFGAPLDLSASGDTLLVGSPTFDGSATSAGRAYIYTKNASGSYVTPQTLVNPGPNSPDGDWFGSAVALDGDGSALVGAFWDDNHIGSAYFYTLAGGLWSMAQKIDAMSLPAGDPGATLFGDAVAFSQGIAAVGAPLANAPLAITEAGAVYVFSPSGVLTGICRNKLTGAPLANVEVSAYVTDAFGDPDLADGVSLAMSDSLGRYTLYLPTGSYPIGYMGLANYWPGFYNGKSLFPDATPVAVTSGTITNLDLYIRPKLLIHRFYNFVNGTHFFTDSDTEKANILASWPHIYSYEGPAYAVNPDADVSPLYRCFNKAAGSHFYTASYDEAIGAQAKWPTVYQYEGPTYPVSTWARPGAKPVYRFYNMRNGSHFYTDSATERDMVMARWPDVYQLEGPAFWITQ